MAAPHQTPPEKVDIHQHPSVGDEKGYSKQTDINEERNELLAALGDPDEGLSEEERMKLDRKTMWKVDLWLIPLVFSILHYNLLTFPC